MATRLKTEHIMRAVAELEDGQFTYCRYNHDVTRPAQPGVTGSVTGFVESRGDCVYATFRAIDFFTWEPLEITPLARLAATFAGIEPLGLHAAEVR